MRKGPFVSTFGVQELIDAIDKLRKHYSNTTNFNFTMPSGHVTYSNSTTSPLKTSGPTAGTSPAPTEREEPVAYKKPEVIPGFRADSPDTIHVIDQIGALVNETRLSTLVQLLDYNGRVESIFSGRQKEAIMAEVNQALWE